MGWAKYHEDNVSRFWRDANTQVRVVHGTQDRPASKAGAGDDLGELKLLRRRLAENPCDRSAQLTFHAEKSRLEKLGISTGEILGVIHGDDRRADGPMDIASPNGGTSLVQRQLQNEIGRNAQPNSPKALAKAQLNKQGERNMSKLKDFTVSTARPLPVIVLADVSGSMSANGKIDALNDAIQSMIESFAAEDHSRAEIHVAVIAFGKGSARLHQALLPAAQIKWERVGAAGNTPMGAAFDLVVKMVEDQAQIPSRAYRPTVVLVSDGQPTDEWREPLQRLLASDRASKASRFVLGIGDDADPAMLAEFLADPSARAYSAHEARQIKNFFRWVTMSVTQRTRSVNPNSVVVVHPTALDDYDF
ncbi:MAG TPA: VWA domain-containing protein [Nitrospira sp.]|jgi:uncharacterized protein YegL|nr:VWA domain-containing protein [Nitrospira sp.]HNF60884.1 VWA domain-containing protein [Rhodocyclaceae bacterium]HNJ21641.1 VWA domain-containing protein [Nitrospira sp.]HNK49075.1 VWA domain-containing protein [Nitrospira sp.]HNM19323.1 VWA domain-containing protein [Nitrospira sp.]